jgi:hypothetical protein
MRASKSKQDLQIEKRTLVHRGTSTIMLRTVLDSSAKRGMSLVRVRKEGSRRQFERSWRLKLSRSCLLEWRDNLALLLDEHSVLYKASRYSVSSGFRWVSREGGRTKGVGSLNKGKGEERAKKSVSER